MIHGLILDMDGLLIDSERVSYECWRSVCAEVGIELSPSTFSKIVGRSPEESHEILRNDLHKDIPAEHLRERKRVVFTDRIKREGIPLKVGASELLSYCKERGIQVAVATSTKSVEVESRLHAAGVRREIPIVVAGDQVTHTKPSPDVYLRALELLNLTPEVCIACEDSASGLSAALSARLRAVWIPDMQEDIPSDIRSRLAGIFPSLLEFQQSYLSPYLNQK